MIDMETIDHAGNSNINMLSFGLHLIIIDVRPEADLVIGVVVDVVKDVTEVLSGIGGGTQDLVRDRLAEDETIDAEIAEIATTEAIGTGEIRVDTTHVTDAKGAEVHRVPKRTRQKITGVMRKLRRLTTIARSKVKTEVSEQQVVQIS